MKAIGSSMKIIAAITLGVWAFRLVAADQPALVITGWDYADRSRHWDIYSLSLSGVAKAIVNGPASETNPFPWPHARAIGYLVEPPMPLFPKGSVVRKIFKYDLDSGVTTDLGVSIQAAASCDASPTGTKIACADNCGRHNQIVVFDLATRERRQISDLGNDCLDPSWSPDGKNLVYWTGGRDDTVGGESKPPGDHLVIRNLETGRDRLLTKTPKAHDAYPRWSPDGTRIAFHRHGKGMGKWHIWTIRPDGTEAVELTTGKLEHSYPAWSPDSQRIAFQCYRVESDTYDICVVDVGTKQMTTITKNPKIDHQRPIWVN
jgi:Tol biopolymer transport system component